MATLFKKEKQQRNTFCCKGGMINAHGISLTILTSLSPYAKSTGSGEL